MRIGKRGALLVGLVGVVLAIALVASLRAGHLRGDGQHHHAERPIERARSLGFTQEPLDAATARSLGLRPSTRGAVVTSVAAGGPADHAGLAVGDVVTSIDGQPPEKAVAMPPQTLIILHHGVARTLQLGYAGPAE